MRKCDFSWGNLLPGRIFQSEIKSMQANELKIGGKNWKAKFTTNFTRVQDLHLNLIHLKLAEKILPKCSKKGKDWLC